MIRDKAYRKWKVKNGANVLYIDGEMPIVTMQERYAKLEAGYRGGTKLNYRVNQ